MKGKWIEGIGWKRGRQSDEGNRKKGEGWNPRKENLGKRGGRRWGCFFAAFYIFIAYAPNGCFAIFVGLCVALWDVVPLLFVCLALRRAFAIFRCFVYAVFLLFSGAWRDVVFPCFLVDFLIDGIYPLNWSIIYAKWMKRHRILHFLKRRLRDSGVLWQNNL